MMTDQPRASQLAGEAFELWQAGRLEEAAPLFRQAIQLADPDHYSLPDYHGELAAVLTALGRKEDALEHWRQYLSLEVGRDPEEREAGAAVARYFLAEHLREMGRVAEALTIIEAAGALRDKSDKSVWFICALQARVLSDLNRRDEAKNAARRPVETAPSAKKSEELRQSLSEILGAGNA